MNDETNKAIQETAEPSVSEPTGCTKIVRRGDSWRPNSQPCGKPVKGEGLCGLHLAARNRRIENDRKMRDKWARDKELQEEADALGAALGTHVAAHYNSVGKGRYDGRFVVDGDWLRALTQATSSLPPDSDVSPGHPQERKTT